MRAEMSEARREDEARARRRADWRTTHEKIVRFLRKALSELEAKRSAPLLMTSPEEIARRTKLPFKVVRRCISDRAWRRVRGKAMVIRVDGTDVVIMLSRERRNAQVR